MKKQDKSYNDRLKKNGIEIKYFKLRNPNYDGKNDKRKTIGFYYKLYAIKKISFNQRCNMVDKLLNRMTNTNCSTRDRIEYMWRNRNYKKTKRDTLFDNESIILSNLAQYLYTGFEHPENNILTDTQREIIKEKEVASFENIGNYINYDGNYKLEGEPNTWQIFISTKKRMKRFKNSKKHKGSVNRWRKTTSYKINKIYTYKNNKTGKYYFYRKGLINPNNPYTAEWCIVDTENIFEFHGNKYKINKSVKQYNTRTKKPRYDDYKNDYKMDKILVYDQDGKMYFFDQNIDRINNDLIELILS